MSTHSSEFVALGDSSASSTVPPSPVPSTFSGSAGSAPIPNAGSAHLELSLIRALDEVATLDQRIEKKVSEASFLAMFSKKNRQTLLPEQFGHSAKSDWQSIHDLIARRNALKAAILESNARTMVTVAGERLTIAEVIDRKKALSLQTNLLQKLKSQRESVLRSVEANNIAMDSELQKLLEIHFGKSSSGGSARSNASDVEEISKSFRESSSAKLLDPIGIDSKIKELEHTSSSSRGRSSSYYQSRMPSPRFSSSSTRTGISHRRATRGEKDRARDLSRIQCTEVAVLKLIPSRHCPIRIALFET